MALYAFDGDSPVYAGDAQERATYRCSGCGHPVRVRKGRFRVPHFYHLKSAPSCRLYSKSEDHLVAQLTIKKLLPEGEVFIEKPFTEILRVADVVWEPRRLIFEVQCSEFTPAEVKRRTDDYHKLGYQLVWILDDRLYNRRHLRPGEELARKQPCYYCSIRNTPSPSFYDQFELFQGQTRFKRGRRLPIYLQTPSVLPDRSWDPEIFPQQILIRSSSNRLYFRGDLLHHALQSSFIPARLFSIQNYKALELFYGKNITVEKSRLKELITEWILEPFGLLVLHFLDWSQNKIKALNS